MEKLKNCDYCENLTKEQFEELIAIENDETKLDYGEVLNYLYFKKQFNILNYIDESLKINLLSFDDFKQRCINTFKK